MKSFVINFLKRGAMFAAGGPVILAIVYSFLLANGVVETVSVERLIREVLTSTLLAFVAAGISAVYTVDRLQKATAGLIQGAVLFLDYIVLYLLNGWLPFTWQAILLFPAIFVVVFAVIWGIIWLTVRHNVNKMNQQLN